MILALFNSKPFDYLVRLKMPGIDLTQSVIRQIPVPYRDIYQRQTQYSGISQSLEQHILERVSVILAEEPMVAALLKTQKPPSDSVQIKPKAVLENELDELFSIAYGLSETELKLIQQGFKY
jgi:hypothetical protein